MSDYSVTVDTSDGPQGYAWMTTASPAMGAMENAATAVRRALAIPLSLSSFLPLLPSSPRRSLPLFLATARGQKRRT
jgi:hypothetical protein